MQVLYGSVLKDTQIIPYAQFPKRRPWLLTLAVPTVSSHVEFTVDASLGLTHIKPTNDSGASTCPSARAAGRERHVCVYKLMYKRGERGVGP